MTVLRTLLELYIYLFSADYQYLIRIGEKTEANRLWAYFLAEELCLSSPSARSQK